MTRDHRKRLAFIIIVLISASILGCSKEALFYSDDLADPGRFRDTTLYAVRTDWDNARHTSGSAWLSQRLVVANAPGPIEQSTFLARTFLWFTSLPETTAKIERASLFLYVTRLDWSGASPEISLYALTDTLDQFHLAWDRMPSMDASPIQTFSVSQSLDSVIVDVTKTVEDWLSGDSENLGLALVTDENPGGVLIAEFASREHPRKEISDTTGTTFIDYRPTLRVVYVDTADTSAEAKYLESVASVDTFADSLFLEKPAESAQFIVCGNGTPSRCFVKFDIDSIPVEASVAKAVLRLTADFENSSFDSIDLICHAAVESTWTHFGSPIGGAGAGRTTLKRFQEQPTVEFDITVLVQPLVARKVKNRGFVIKSANEGADIDFVKFFAAGAPQGLEPELEIHYVLPAAKPYEDR